MKKLILAVCVATCALSVFAQGTIVVGNHVLNVVVAPVYGPDPANNTAFTTGNTPNGFPAGTQTYVGAAVGNAYSAELYGGPNASSLTPTVGGIVNFAVQGFFATLGTAATVNGVASGQAASLQLNAWNNQGGTITTWAQALPLWNAGTIDAGQSAIFTSQNLGGGPNLPPNLIGLTSFNTHFIPEPSIFALAGLGAAALLIFRRRQ